MQRSFYAATRAETFLNDIRMWGSQIMMSGRGDHNQYQGVIKIEHVPVNIASVQDGAYKLMIC